MAHLAEPLSLEIERFSVHSQEKDGNHTHVDYSKLPRSSGDGMEFSSSSSSDASSSESNNESDLSQRKNSSLKNTAFIVKEQNSRSHVINTSTGKRTILQPENHGAKHSDGYTIFEGSQVKQEKAEPIIIHRNENNQLNSKSVQRQNSRNLLFQEPELPCLNSHSGLSLNGDNQFVSLAPPASELSLREHAVKSTVVEHAAEFVDSQKVINELEERNSKLVQEKTKLSVQLGVQTKVNAEIKRLLVASVGEDIGNRLEDLVSRNVQQAVELNHWKKMCEEYSEESDRLEIECDVWRTKFLASRMMSDELSSWKVALYTRFRQAQSALQRLLDERAQLLQYLVHTKRFLQSLYSMLRSTGGMLQRFSPAHSAASEHSIIEMASINSSLAEETLNLAQNVLPVLSLSETSLILTQGSQEKTNKLKMEPSSAEKLALQVLSSDVDLQDEQQQLRGVMKRMSQQYMGHGYQSRFSTKNFRVTYDCCDRCTGTLQVV